jgi:hypothetical protein
MRPTNSISIKTAIPAALIALIACITLAAAGQDIVVKVPFDFQAGETHFAPGSYTLSMDEVVSGAVVIRSADQGGRAILLARKSTSPGYGTNPTVVFRSYGDTRFLIAVQSEGSGRWELTPSEREVEIASLHGDSTVASLKASSPAKP